MSTKPKVQKAAAAAQLVTLDTPVSGAGVPLEFCASGTYDSSVTSVTLELIDDGGGVYNFRPSMGGGDWSRTIRLPSTSATAVYELRAYFHLGDGGNAVNLTYNSTLA